MKRLWLVALLLWAAALPARGIELDRECACQPDALVRVMCLVARIQPQMPVGAKDPDLVVGDTEVLKAIEVWIVGEGEILIDDGAILTAVELWIRGTPWTDLLRR